MVSRHKFISCDPEKCVGCRICEYICSQEKEKVFNPLRSRVRVVRLYPNINLSIACRLCEDAPCVISCPRKALEQSKENGLIIVNEDKCNGCGWCIEACDFGAITLHTTKRVAVMCDLCSTRSDRKPQCVEWCPEKALETTDRDILAQKARIDSTKKLIKASITSTT